jgi:hypothetical protein
MAGDWIKMRTDLYRDPKVILMADNLLGENSDLSRYVNQNVRCDMRVTRNVMRNAVVGALVNVWGVVRHQGSRDGSDLVLSGCTEAVVDDIADMQGFGEAMAVSGWLTIDANGLRFPKFFAENNSDPKEDQNAKNAERQRRYRESKKAQSNVTRNVTCSAKSNARVEKSRVENNNIGGTKSEITIPSKLNDHECLAAAETWMDYLDSKDLQDKSPRGNDIALQAWWQQMAKLGRDGFLEAVTQSMAAGRWNVELKQSYTERGKPTASKEWLLALKAAKSFPKSDDWEKRKKALGDELFEALKRTGSKAVAESNDFEQKTLKELFESHLKDIRNGITVGN